MLVANKLLVVLAVVLGTSTAVKDFRRPSWQDDDDQWTFSDLNWKAKEAIKEYYVNWLLNGLKKEEAHFVDDDLPSSTGGETPAIYYTRHRPTKYHPPVSVMDDDDDDGGGGGGVGIQYQDSDDELIHSEEQASDKIESYYFPDRHQMHEIEQQQQQMRSDDEVMMKPSPSRITSPKSDFAFPPSDHRFFAPSVQLNDDDQPDLVTTKRVIDDDDDDDQPLYSKVEAYDRPALELQKMRHNYETTEKTSDNDDGVVVSTRLMDLNSNRDNIILIALVAGCSTGVIAGIALLIYGFIRLQRKAKAAADVDYPAYGVTGPNKESTPTGDRRLAHSAQMYHYQLTKQQIIAMESNRGERRGSISEADSDDDNEEGDYTVYECPGLATTGEMEVKNPLFQDDPTPAAGGGGATGTEQLIDIKESEQQPPKEPKQQ